MVKMAVTGLGGIALAIPCAYAGLAGGAVVGGLLGGAMGPVAGALTDHGVMSAIGTAWHSAGTMGHVGVVLGTATALAGAFSVSSAIGSIGMHDSKPKAHANLANPVTFAAGTVLLTAGIAAGAVGGLALAGGAAAAGTVVNGLIHHGFTAAALAGVGHNAVLAGALGGGTAAVVGGAGGAKLTLAAARNIVDPATNFIHGMIKGDKH